MKASFNFVCCSNEDNRILGIYGDDHRDLRGEIDELQLDNQKITCK